MDIYPPARQRAALLEFVEAIGSAPRALRRDECGDPRVNGSRGHVYAVPGTSPGRTGFQIFVMGWSIKGWNAAREAIGKFASVTNEGDDEGALFLDRLPTSAEAEVIRKWCGVPKRVEYSEATLEAKRAAMANARLSLSA